MTQDENVIEYLYRRSHLLKEEDTQASRYLLARFRSLPIIGLLIPSPNTRSILVSRLMRKQKLAVTYAEWYEISLQLDELLEKNGWKQDPVSPIYDYELVQSILEQMKLARLAEDYNQLLYLIRTTWVRNLGNMGDINLYRNSFVGTKKLIEDYLEECKLCLDYLVRGDHDDLDDQYLLGMLIQTRRNIGRTAIVLSGGSTFGIFHIGVLLALLENELLPRIISGSSSGSIIASILCSHSFEDTSEILQGITNRKFIIFGEDETLTENNSERQSGFRKVLKNLGHLLKYGTLFDIDGLKNTMISFVGDLTFREAYNRTGRILNITVSPASNHEQTRLLNYITAPHCLIWSAVCASCSLPGVFPSTSIYEKVPKTNEVREWNNDASIKYVDGSVDNDLPITRLLEMFNVDHIIACQVNPHVVPILKVSVSSVGGGVENDLTYKFKQLLNECYDFFTNEIIHYMQILNEMDIQKTFANKLVTLLSQKYSGDITILPDFKVSDFFKIFQNPTSDFLVDFILRGARASWPKVTVISNHCGVEFTLDKAISEVRGRLILKSSSHHEPEKKDSTRRIVRAMSMVSSPVEIKRKPIMSPLTSARSKTYLANNWKLPPALRRHNSVSNNQRYTSTNKHPVLKIDSSAAASGTHRKSNRKRNSTTALYSMNFTSPTSVPLSADATYVNDQQDSIKSAFDNDVVKANAFKNYHVSADNKMDDNVDEDFFDRSRVEAGPSPQLLARYSNFDYDKSAVSESPSSSRTRKSANLPTMSNPNSRRESYTGLNRLQNNSYTSAYSPRDANPENLRGMLMNLASPDIRRKYIKEYNRSNLHLDNIAQRLDRLLGETETAGEREMEKDLQQENENRFGHEGTQDERVIDNIDSDLENGVDYYECS